MKKIKIAVNGTQASGKGTQSYIMSVTTGMPVVSIGDLLRELQKEDSERGRTVNADMLKGEFPPDEIVLPLLKEWIAKHPDGWIIDGFPRTIQQAIGSDAFFKPDLALFLNLPDEEAKRRISYRRICSKCKTNYNLITQPPQNPQGVCDKCGGALVQRADDTPELVAKRLEHYHAVTEPVRDFYRKKGILVEIDARPGIREVANEIGRRLEAQLGRKRVSMRRIWWLLASLATLIVFFAGLTLIGLMVG